MIQTCSDPERLVFWWSETPRGHMGQRKCATLCTTFDGPPTPSSKGKVGAVNAFLADPIWQDRVARCLGNDSRSTVWYSAREQLLRVFSLLNTTEGEGSELRASGASLDELVRRESDAGFALLRNRSVGDPVEQRVAVHGKLSAWRSVSRPSKAMTRGGRLSTCSQLGPVRMPETTAGDAAMYVNVYMPFVLFLYLNVFRPFPSVHKGLY